MGKEIPESLASRKRYSITAPGVMAVGDLAGVTANPATYYRNSVGKPTAACGRQTLNTAKPLPKLTS